MKDPNSNNSSIDAKSIRLKINEAENKIEAIKTMIGYDGLETRIESLTDKASNADI